MTHHPDHQDAAPEAAAPAQPAALAYSQLVLSNVVDWYKAADSKAQIILTLDGALVAFLTTSIFKSRTELSGITDHFSHRTWFLLIAMCVCLVGSIVSALGCLWSRVFLVAKPDSVLAKDKRRMEAGEPSPPSLMLYFKTIRWIGHDRFLKEIAGTDATFQTKAFASQAFLLSGRVYGKHLWVNAGFVLAGASFILFLASGMSYLLSPK